MRTKEETRAAFFCLDCGFDTLGSEFYMVKNHIWELTGVHIRGGMLCIGCLENRIGRSLTKQDFMPCLLNLYTELGEHPGSDRLLSRMLGTQPVAEVA